MKACRACSPSRLALKTPFRRRRRSCQDSLQARVKHPRHIPPSCRTAPQKRSSPRATASPSHRQSHRRDVRSDGKPAQGSDALQRWTLNSRQCLCKRRQVRRAQGFRHPHLPRPRTHSRAKSSGAFPLCRIRPACRRPARRTAGRRVSQARVQYETLSSCARHDLWLRALQCRPACRCVRERQDRRHHRDVRQDEARSCGARRRFLDRLLLQAFHLRIRRESACNTL